VSIPAFFDSIEKIRLEDPLAAFLGVFEGGVYEISYLDVVKAAGHSCPTLAGAYLMSRESLKTLYGERPARRGDITVSFAESCDSGVTGVMAQVVSNITGATGSWGFKGIAGRFKRTGLMDFDAAIDGAILFGRRDTGQQVLARYSPGGIVQAAPLLQRLLGSAGNSEAEKEAGAQWQKMVEEIFSRFTEVLEIIPA